MNVLFIGNSHTYLHYMPQMLAELARAADIGFPLNIDQSTGEGAGLQWHWNNPPARDKIRSRRWDRVVLQDRSGGSLEELESFQTHARRLDEEIRRRGAKTVFYMTWANKSQPHTQKIIADAYGQIATELDAVLAPVGLAWEKALALDEELNLHHIDDRHANPSGAYLTACVFYSVFFNASPEGLPATLQIEGKIRLDLAADRAGFLQKIAYETVSNAEVGMTNDE
jgi:Asp-tRNA(Asn)/Glu-tRNA(Gln) amidotransferase A subunit family amidase